jgi:GTP-binding protein HflX
MGKSLSRLGGGIGTRGPGESKLEQDRRHVRSRIDLLEKEIEEVAKRRLITKGSRQRSGMPMVALVGYTNAGKSSILNWICDANEVAENQLFATWDSVTRLFKLSNKREVLLTDTVGFIHKLPHQLVAAFRSTLDELKDAELLLHIVDISDANYEEQIQTTMSLLEELEVQQPIIRVFNKIDALPTLGVLQRAMSTCENAVAVSVVENQGKCSFTGNPRAFRSRAYGVSLIDSL